MENPKVRYTPPTKLVPGDYQSVLTVIGETAQDITYYIQTSVDADNPQWVTFGDFLAKVFADQIIHASFIDDLMPIYLGTIFPDDSADKAR